MGVIQGSLFIEGYHQEVRLTCLGSLLEEF